MNEFDVGKDLIESAFARFGYPADLLADYDQLECLSSHQGRETFLVRKKSDGSLAVAKCYDREIYSLLAAEAAPAGQLDHPGLPRYLARYDNEKFICIVREYIAGVPLSDYVREQTLTQPQVVAPCLQLCDILI